MSVKIGIAGAGNMGKNHIRLTREMSNLFELVGIYDPNEDSLKRLSLEEYATKSIDELIEKSDALIIAAPSSLHKEIALKAGVAQKHILVEKPLALSEEDAIEIKNQYNNLDKVLMVGHVERFNSAVLELEKILEDEKVLAVNIERCSSMDLRISDTDVIYDLMIHDVDILLHSILPKAELNEIVAFGRKTYSAKYVDYVQALFRFNNDAIASIVCSRTTESKIRKMHIHCEKSYVEIDLLNKNVDIYRKTQMKAMGMMPTAYRQENVMEHVFVPNNEPLRVELMHFYECINGLCSCKTDANSSIKVIRVLDMIKNQIYK